MKRGLIIGAAVVLIVAITLWITRTEKPEVEEPEYSEECDDTVDPILVYGIHVDTLDVSVGKVKKNETLSVILEQYGVGYRDVYALVQQARDVFNVRKIKADDPYVVIHSDRKRAYQFILEPNEREYVIYHLGDSIYAEKIERKVDIKEKEFSGEITSSVYMTAINNGGSPQLVHRLVDVFAWQVDFFRIQKGDKFKVIYEEEQVDGSPVGIRRIKAAWFEHFGKEFYAVYFTDENEMGDYFDECANSVRRAFMKAPLNYSRISSRYSASRFHPVLKRYKAHLGTDYAAPTGTPIRSVGNGVVTEAQYKGGNGNYVKIRHNSTYSTQYLHMSKIASGIRPGVAVEQGQTIGYVGSTGLATGPHLCFRFWKNGVQVDALKVDLPPAKPVDAASREEYAILRDEMVSRLDDIKIPSPILKAEIPSE